MLIATLRQLFAKSQEQISTLQELIATIESYINKLLFAKIVPLMGKILFMDGFPLFGHNPVNIC